MSMLKYFLWLSTMNGMSKKTAYTLLSKFKTPEALYYATETQLKKVYGITEYEKKLLTNKSMDRVEWVLEECNKKDIKIITLFDAYYPERLKHIPVPPIVLYIKGKVFSIDDEMCVAFVGPRKPRVEAIHITQKLAMDFADLGGMVVSGMALGIDGASHRGAMEVGKPTIAVLGCGLDICYPRANMDIYQYICANGSLISEYAPKEEPKPYHFPERNRIISGISLGVVVTEAPKKSGSLITANHANEQGRDVFVVPGSVGDKFCEGSNALLKDGAKAVMDVIDIVEEYIRQYPHKISSGEHDTKRQPFSFDGNQTKENNNALPEDVLEELNSVEQSIVRVLERGKLHIDNIAEETLLPVSDVLSAITTLEINGIVCQLPGKYFELII